MDKRFADLNGMEVFLFFVRPENGTGICTSIVFNSPIPKEFKPILATKLDEAALTLSNFITQTPKDELLKILGKE